ncbi:MAG: hypothetical protein SV910_06335 [Chloroflexota bacterium]|nr:hypothetical protein [Chloroflexota bacterium]
MRLLAAIVVGVASGTALVVLLSLVVAQFQSYSPVVAGVIGGLLVALALWVLSREIGLIIGIVVGLVVGLAVGLALAFLPILVEGVRVEQVVAVEIMAFSYFMAGVAAGASFGASWGEGYGWGRGTLLPGLLSGALVFTVIWLMGTPSFIQRFGTIGAFSDVASTVVLIVSALALGAWGGAVGGQLAGARS